MDFLSKDHSNYTICSGVLEGILRDVLAGRLGDYLQVLDHARRHLVLEPAVFSLGVLSDCYQVHVFVGSVDALDGLARADVGEEVQPLSEGHVEGSEAFADWGFKRAFKAVFVALDCLDAFVGDQVTVLSLALCMDLV